VSKHIDNKREVEQIFDENKFILNSQGIYSPTSREWDLVRVKEEILLRVTSILDVPVNLWQFLWNIEQNGLEYEFDTKLLRVAMNQVSEIQKNGWEDRVFHFNLYPKSFMDSYYSGEITRIMDETKVRTDKIVFELLETWQRCETLCHPESEKNWIKMECWGCICSMNWKIKLLYDDLWIKVAIDDYGNWHNNTELLKKLRFYKIVKIDWEVIDELLKEWKQLLIKELSHTCIFLKKQNPILEEITFEKIDTQEKYESIMELYSLFQYLGIKMSFQWYLFEKPTPLK